MSKQSEFGDKEVKLLMKHIKTITNSGLETIDPSLWENIRELFKQYPPLIDKAFGMVMIELKKPHAQVRYAAFMLCNELFKRSHNFRANVSKKLEEIFELTAGTNPNRKKPLPKSAAQKLKTLALRTILDWKQRFGTRYPAIFECFYYLQRCKDIDFDAVKRDIEAEAVAKVERKREQERVRRLMFDSFIEEFDVKAADIEELIRVIDNCTLLLIPSLDDFFVEGDDNTMNSHDGEDFDMRLFGLRASYNLEVKINQKVPVVKNEENSAVIENLLDSVKIAKKRYVQLVQKWEDVVQKYSKDSSYQEKVLNLKTRLETALKKYEELDIAGCCDNSDDDADMVEVVKEDYEADVLPVVRDLRKSSKQEPQPSSSSSSSAPSASSNEPTSSKQNLMDDPKPGPSTRKERLLAIAPKLPYDVDLYHWEDEDLKAPKLISVQTGNSKFWGGSDAGDVNEIPNPDGIAALRSRVIEFTGKFEPVTRTCRAKLPSGKLCPRRDRFRCPFHGEIVPRDENGKSALSEDKSEPIPVEKHPEETVPEWQDPALLAQLKAATGIDLKMPEKRKKGIKKNKPSVQKQVEETIKSKNFPGISNIGILKNNPKARLKKKIFNRSAVKRVAEAYNKMDQKKYCDKFGDQFNYF